MTNNSPMVSYSVDGGLTKVSTGNKSSDINKYVLNSSFTYTLTDGQRMMNSSVLMFTIIMISVLRKTALKLMSSTKSK